MKIPFEDTKTKVMKDQKSKYFKTKLKDYNRIYVQVESRNTIEIFFF